MPPGCPGNGNSESVWRWMPQEPTLQMFCMSMFVCAFLLASLHKSCQLSCCDTQCSEANVFSFRLFFVCTLLAALTFDLGKFVERGRGSVDVLPVQPACFLFSPAVVTLLCCWGLLMGVTHMNCIPWFVVLSAAQMLILLPSKRRVANATPNTNTRHHRFGSLQDRLVGNLNRSMKLRSISNKHFCRSTLKS